MPSVEVESGVELNYMIDDYTDPWDEPEYVLLHHAAMGNAKRWYAWAAELARHFKVIRFDMRGHGESTVPDREYTWSIEELAGDIRSLLDALDVERVHLIGASAGGAVSLQFAADYPDYLHTLTLVATKPGMKHMDKTAQDYQEWLRVVRERGVKQLFLEQASIRFNPERVDPRLIEWFAEESAKTPIHVIENMIPYLGTVDLLPLLPRITTPTLLIAPDEDPLGPMQVQQTMLDLLPNARLEILKGWSHNISSTAVRECLDLVLPHIRGGAVGGREAQ